MRIFKKCTVETQTAVCLAASTWPNEIKWCVLHVILIRHFHRHPTHLFQEAQFKKNTLRLLWFRRRVVYTKIAAGSIPLATVASPKCPWAQSWNGWNSFNLNIKVCSSQMFQHAQPHQELCLCSWQAFQKDLDRRSPSRLIERRFLGLTFKQHTQSIR